ERGCGKRRWGGGSLSSRHPINASFRIHALRATLYALLLSQPPRHLLEYAPLLARQAVEPFRGDLVENAVHVFGLEVARYQLSRRRDRGWTLRRECLALRDNLVDFLHTLTRARQGAWNRARRIIRVRHLRNALAQLLDAHARRRAHVQPSDD